MYVLDRATGEVISAEVAHRSGWVEQQRRVRVILPEYIDQRTLPDSEAADLYLRGRFYWLEAFLQPDVSDIGHPQLVDAAERHLLSQVRINPSAVIGIAGCFASLRRCRCLPGSLSAPEHPRLAIRSLEERPGSWKSTACRSMA